MRTRQAARALVALAILICGLLVSFPEPAAAQLLAPSNASNASGTRIQFNWAYMGQGRYTFEVARDPGFTSMFYGIWEQPGFVGFSLGGFPDNGATFYWRVRFEPFSGNGQVAGPWSFVNGPSAPPDMPSPGAPADGATVNGANVSFGWSLAARANDYRLQIAVDAAFSGLVLDQWLGNFQGVDVSGFPGAGQRYYWRVAARNAAGSSAFSAARSFVNNPNAPPTPALSSPVDGATVPGDTVTFRWNAAPAATDYFLQLASDPGFTSLLFGGWLGGSDPMATLAPVPANGQRLYWRVAAGNVSGNSFFSSARSFVNAAPAAPETPTLSSPLNGSNVPGTVIPLSWNPIASATNYRLTIAADAAFANVLLDGWVGNAIAFTLDPEPDDGQQYYWRITASNAAGTSAPSTAWSFVNGPSALPGPTALTNPDDGGYVPGALVQFRWNPAERANNYRLTIAFDSAFTQLGFDDWLGNFSGIDFFGFPDDGTRFYWRVTPGNAKGSGPGSAARSFVNGLNPSCAPALGSGQGLLVPRPHVDTCLDASGMYFLADVSRRANQNPHGHNGQMAATASIHTQTEGAGVATDPDNVWNASTQAALVDAQAQAAAVYDYHLGRLGLNGFDNAGSSMLSIVDSSDPNSCPNNAFWDGFKVNYCANSGIISFVAALDVVAHEWGHAVTQYASGLVESKESGALNEAFSDWIGTATEQANGGTNWTIGESVLLIRDMANPPAHQQADTYGGTFWFDTTNCTPSAANDFCAVHQNTGVPNKMFYLLSSGGTHNGVQVQGLGIDKAMRIGLSANRFDWLPSSTLAQARSGMVQAAKRIYGEFSNEQTQVRRAWAAVRVGSVPPVADAGAAQTVGSGSAVMLRGSATDQDGIVVSYAWTQVAGPAVSLVNAGTTTASFTAPTVSVDTVLTFRLVVTDDAGEVGNSTVDVTVRKPGPSPAI